MVGRLKIALVHIESQGPFVRTTRVLIVQECAHSHKHVCQDMHTGRELYLTILCCIVEPPF